MSLPPRRPRPAPVMASVMALGLALSGCDQPSGSARARPTKARPPREVAEAPAPPPAPAPVGPRPILNQRTQDIRDMAAEQKAGGVVKAPKITAKDPITLPGNAYVSIIGQLAMGQITHTLDLYQATNGEYPKTYDEFMAKVIKENNIALPRLPFYQEYGYDVPNHKLIILEYEDRKDAANYPR